MTTTIYWLHQNLTFITLILVGLRAIIASLKQWRGQRVRGYRVISIGANSLLDTQILLGLLLMIFGITPPAAHLVLVAVAAILAHYSYSVEKRKGSSLTTTAAAWGSVITVAVLFL